MLKIRLFRTGKKNQAHFKIVVIESTHKRNGKYVDLLGHYTPGTETSRVFSINQEKVDKWIKNGAQMTSSLKNLIKTIEKPKIANNQAPKEKVEKVTAKTTKSKKKEL